MGAKFSRYARHVDTEIGCCDLRLLSCGRRTGMAYRCYANPPQDSQMSHYPKSQNESLPPLDRRCVSLGQPPELSRLLASPPARYREVRQPLGEIGAVLSSTMESASRIFVLP